MIQTMYPEPMTIFRQKKPELLRLSIGNQEYAGVVAQSIIDNKWGAKFLWKACSYSSQGERCSLLTESQNDRFEILNKIAFGNDDPKKYIDDIDLVLTQITRDYTLLKEYHNNNVSTFQRNHSLSGLNDEDFQHIAELDNIMKRYIELAELRSKLKIEWAKEEQKKNELIRLENRLNQLNNEVSQ